MPAGARAPADALSPEPTCGDAGDAGPGTDRRPEVTRDWARRRRPGPAVGAAMAHITINQYLQQVYEAIDTRDGASCAELVSFKHPHVANPRLQMASPEEKCQQVLEPPYDEMFAAHLRCTYAVGNHDFIEAYKCQTVIVQSFLRAFQAHKEENWALPVMYAVALDLRVFANNFQTRWSRHVCLLPPAGSYEASEALRAGEKKGPTRRARGSEIPELLVCLLFVLMFPEKPETQEHQQAEMKKTQGEQEGGAAQQDRPFPQFLLHYTQVCRYPHLQQARGELDPPHPVQRAGAPVSPRAWCQQRPTDMR
uniref:PCI domain containing 2 n=1 Tax=Equus caballus TaxID=9796 RepID=A0A9L0RD09_HORSE